MYVVALRPSDFGQGIYHYNVKCNVLEMLSSRSVRQQLVRATGEEWVGKASIAIILTGIFGRMQAKYGERGYRYLLMEAGHMMQNICLTAEALELGACPCGGFIDHEVNDLLDLDESTEATVYIAFLGHKLPTS